MICMRASLQKSVVSNKMTNLINKIERRLGLIPLTPHLPEYLQKPAWAEIIKDDTLITFSRYFYHKIRFEVNSDTCFITKENNITTYYIRDESLNGLTLLGISDIDWNEYNSDNLSLSQTGGYGYYMPDYMGCPQCTYEAMIGLQMAADMQSLYNRGIFLEPCETPNKFRLTGAGGVNVNLKKFVINLLVVHPSNLNTISPTKMEIFESLAQSDVANYLYKNLKYVDGLETVYINLDLKLDELRDESGKRENIIEEIKNSYVSTANENIPYIMTI